MNRTLLLMIALVIFHLPGCGAGDAAPRLGTAGRLMAADQPVAEFEVRLFKAGDSAPLAIGVTSLDGRFQLSLPDGSGACWLDAGDYLVVLESIGPAVVKLPPTYRDPQKTPLKVTWRSEDTELRLTIPALK